MNIIGCLDTPTSGEYHLDDNEVSLLDDNELAAIRNKKIGFDILIISSVIKEYCA